MISAFPRLRGQYIQRIVCDLRSHGVRTNLGDSVPRCIVDRVKSVRHVKSCNHSGRRLRQRDDEGGPSGLAGH